MIVDCQSCHTRFRLDDARIPATGAKVRCSRCKTAFVVHRPKASVDEVVEEVVAEATAPGSSSAPEPTSDLFGTSGRMIGETLPAIPTPGAEEGAGEEQWEFDEAPPATRAPEVAVPAARVAPPPPAPVKASPEPREEEELPSLGAPGDWDLLGASAERMAAGVSFKPARPAPAPDRAREVAPPEPVAAVDTVEAALRNADAAATALDGDRSAPAWRDALGSAFDFVVVGSGWIAASALCLIGLALAVQPRIWAADPGGPRLLTATLGGAQHELSLYQIDSGVAGSLIVVRGQLPPSDGSSEPMQLRASWLDADGAPIAGAGAIAGPPLAKRKLREHSLARLQADHEAHALEVTADGGPFEAVFAALPSGAARMSLSLARAPVAEPAPAVGAAATPEPAGEASDATP